MSARDRFFQAKSHWQNPTLGRGPPHYLENAYNAGYVQEVDRASSGLPPRRRQTMDAAVKYHLKQKQHMQQLAAERDALAKQLEAMSVARRNDTLRFREQLTQFSKQIATLKDGNVKPATSSSSGGSGPPPVERVDDAAGERDDGRSAGREGMPSEVLPAAGVPDPDRHASEHDE